MRPIRDFPVLRHRLANGLNVAILPDPGSPAVALNLSFQVGSVDEVPGRTGFAHLFEHLMFQGSDQVAPGEHLASIESVGGAANAYTSSDRTVYHETVPAGAFELALWLEADRLRSLAVTQANLDAQRGVVVQEKAQRYDNRPYGDMLEALVAQHFGQQHPYGHIPIGSLADLHAASLDDVTAFHRRWYRPSQAHLVIVGAVDPETAIAMVEQHFADLEDAPSPDRGSITHEALPGGTRELIREVPHPLVHRSWLAPAADQRDHLALELGVAVLTQGHASRLHHSLVKDQGVAREVHAIILPHMRANSIASIMVRPADGIDTQTVLGHLDQALAAFTGPLGNELERAKAQYERDWLEQLATVEDRAEAVGQLWFTHGDPTAINTWLDELASITPEDVARVISSRPGESQLHYLPRNPS